ncbi:hypothetical protein ACFPRL_26590 [Pseudoclavibacter helvolus]
MKPVRPYEYRPTSLVSPSTYSIQGCRRSGRCPFFVRMRKQVRDANSRPERRLRTARGGLRQTSACARVARQGQRHRCR